MINFYLIAILENTLKRLLFYNLIATLDNTMKNRGLTAAFSMDGKNMYTFESTNEINISGKKAVMASVKNSLNINTPYKNLLYLQSTVDYRENKALKLDTSLFVYRLLKKNATFKGKISIILLLIILLGIFLNFSYVT